MSEVERNKTSETMPTACTDKTLAVEKDVFRSFIEQWAGINPDITEADCDLVKECMQDDNIEASELAKAMKQAYKDPNRYGKVEWNDIWKHIKSQREQQSKQTHMPIA